mgnify:CR=1 FL=1
MSNCKTCEHQGYSTHLCMLHRRHEMITEKRAISKHRQLALLDKKKALEIVASEKKKKTFKDVGMAAAVGAAIGCGSGYGSVVLLGGVLAIEAIAAPLVIGAAVVGTGIGAVVSLTNSMRGNRRKEQNSARKSRKRLPVFGLKSTKQL